MTSLITGPQKVSVMILLLLLTAQNKINSLPLECQTTSCETYLHDMKQRLKN